MESLVGFIGSWAAGCYLLGVWNKLHRELMEKALWLTSTSHQRTVLITLLMMANHKGNQWEFNGQKFICKPGQMVTSLESIARKCGKGVTILHVRRALQKFEKFEFLVNKSTNTGRLITICNWGTYQDRNFSADKQMTKQRQTDDKQMTSNNNENNDNNDKNIYIDFRENEYEPFSNPELHELGKIWHKATGYWHNESRN
ncbi:MAG: hypothetical protein JEZ07_03005 [Phycisphaerae bacterium]|nr:hypothetical protein [Phycisphaerae bacterium]